MIVDHPLEIPGLTHGEQNALDVLVRQWRRKRPRNNIRSAFYDMKNSERTLFSEQVPDVVRRRRFVLGWSALSVDKLSRRCHIEGFYDGRGADLNALGLDEIVEDNRLLTELGHGTHASLMHGPAFLVTTQGDTQSGEPDVMMHPRGADVATATWDVRRRVASSFLSVSALSEDDGEPTGLTLYLPNLTVTCTRASSSSRWVVDRRPHSYGVPVDILRYRERLGRPFGASRINDTVMSLHMQALATMIRADVNGEAYSLPRYALLGVGEEAFKNADGSPKPSWRAAWDAIWAIADDPDAVSDNLARADVKQFTGQSPEPQNAHLRMLAQMFSGETGIPIGELGMPGDANPTSAEALLVSRDDLIAESRSAMRLWAPDLSSAVRRALEMHNRRPLPDVRPRALWADPVESSPAVKADAGLKTIQAHPWLADTEVGLEILGLAPDQIKRAKNERDRMTGRTRVLGALERLTSGDVS